MTPSLNIHQQLGQVKYEVRTQTQIGPHSDTTGLNTTTKNGHDSRGIFCCLFFYILQQT